MNKAVIFDAFGTLIRPGRGRSPYAILAGADARAWRERFLKQNKGMDQFARELGALGRLGEAMAALDEEMNGLALFDDVCDAISRLRESGLRLVVCSNLAKPYGGVVKRLLPNMDGYCFSYEQGAMKPEPAVYAKALEMAGCKAEEAVFVGDSKRCDCLGPRGFGMDGRHLQREEGQTLLSVLV